MRGACYLCGFPLRPITLADVTHYTFTTATGRQESHRVHASCLATHLEAKKRTAERAAPKKKYNGWRVDCRCTCARCGRLVHLEGYSDADGAHYCPYCRDYVPVVNLQCAGRTPALVEGRARMIKEAGALEE